MAVKVSLRSNNPKARMSQSGHSRRFGCFGQPSACPLRIRKRPNRWQQRNDA